MKNVFKNLGMFTLCMGIAFGLQHVPFQDVFSVKAQTTTRMIAGPHEYPFISTYLTPVSSTQNTNLPTYALPALTTHNNGQPLTIDVNADGLLDYVYSYYASGTAASTKQFVILNTGSGFNLAYICDYTLASGVHTYKGDCAQ
jgi:hypothetical protein